MSAGKGDAPRPVHGPTYRENYERIYPRHQEMEPTRGEVFDGHKYLGKGGWHAIDNKDAELRDKDE